MDPRTKQTLKSFQTHSRIKNILTIICYCMIFGGFLTYISHALKQRHVVKIVNDYKKNPGSYKTQKTMINPHTNFQYNDTQIYHIQAKKASHSDNNEAMLYDVFANGGIGNITAGQLKIDDKGDHLVFTQNPVLILNKTAK